MTLNDFGDISEFLDHITEMTRMFKEYTDISTCFKTDQHRVDFKFRAFDNPDTDKTLNTLMNGCTGNTALPCYLQVGYSCIFCDYIQNFPVEVIDLQIFRHFYTV